MNKTMKTLLATFLIASLLSGLSRPPVSAAESGGAASPAPAQQTVLLEKSYSDMLREWSDLPEPAPSEIVVNPSTNPENRSGVVAKADSRGYHSDTVRFGQDSKVTVQVEVPQTGLYQIAFDYFITDDSILATEGYIQVNGEYPFYESRRILFPNLWQQPNAEKKVDRYGNDLLVRPVKVQAWQHAYATDASYYYLTPLLYKLEKGVNTITFVNTRGELLLGDVTVNTPADIENYEAYRKAQPAANDAAALKAPIAIEAETPKYKSDSSIRAMNEQDPKITPYDTRHKLLNTFGGGSWEDGGQTVTWEMEAPQDGYYKLAFKYRQMARRDMPTFRRIEIDGKVPFEELGQTAFPYRKKWGNLTVGPEDQPYEIYLTKGKHTLTMSVNLEPVRPLSEAIVSQMKEINRLTLEIKKLTGNKTNAYRDWSLQEYIPGLDQKLSGWADQLQGQYDAWMRMNPDGGDITELVNLKMAVKRLRSLAEDPDRLPSQMHLFSDGSSSVAQLLGDVLQRVSKSPLDLDRIYLYQEGKLPKANAGFFAKLWESIKRFFLSFSSQSYSAADNTSELNVWVNRGRPHVELIQKMIDEQFTPETGIAVKLSIMPDQNKLVLANASGKQPDVALGVDNWIPYELAIRNAVVDLRKFDDYEEVIKRFSKGALIPFTFEQGVYALPETQDFWVLFYRKDILDSLKLEAPDTWDDVVKMLPELQRLGMNFFEPMAMHGGFKPFSATTPFIYQFGGELWSEDGMRTAIDSEASLEAIKYMTDLFTIYNVPQSVPNFYHHFRYGTLPVGVSNFNTYIQLKAAAPEIANWWKIAPHPGVEKDGTVQRWSSSGGQTGMILKGTEKEEEAWTFLKWWLSTDAQVEFANQAQTVFGPTFMWNTANLEAFEKGPWPEEDKKVILEQHQWVREASRVPAAYMVERELSNVWNAVVFNGTNPRTAIDDAVVRANRENIRKMEEFGYYKDGRMLKPYPVPTIGTIDEWVVKR